MKIEGQQKTESTHYQRRNRFFIRAEVEVESTLIVHVFSQVLDALAMLYIPKSFPKLPLNAKWIY
jgi:hypothetical protein